MSRTPEQVVWDFVQSWLAKADTDLQVARHILNAEITDYASAGFHAQQSAEKHLKAFLVRHQVAFPKTHDINELLRLAARTDERLLEELSFAASLTSYAVEFRYPGAETVLREMAESAVSDAQVVQRIVMMKLASYLSEGRPE